MDAEIRDRVLRLALGEVRAGRQDSDSQAYNDKHPHVASGPTGGQFAKKGESGGPAYPDYKSILPSDSAYKSGGGGGSKSKPTGSGVPAAPAEPRTMAPGDSGEDVRYAQYALSLLGFKVPQDGHYDASTVAAVKQMQERLGVKKPNGKLSAAQLRKLQDAVRLSPCVGQSRSFAEDLEERNRPGQKYTHGWVPVAATVEALSTDELDRDYGEELDRLEIGDGCVVARPGVVTIERETGGRYEVLASPGPTEAAQWADLIEGTEPDDEASDGGLRVTRDADGAVTLDFGDEEGLDLNADEADEFVGALRDMGYTAEDAETYPDDEIDEDPDDESARALFLDAFRSIDAEDVSAEVRFRLLAIAGVPEVRNWTPAQEAMHPRGRGGKFTKVAERIGAALHDWMRGDGPDDPLPESEFSRENLRLTAKGLGIPPRRGATVEQLKEDLKAWARESFKEVNDKTPRQRGIRFTLKGPKHRDTDVGVFVQSTDWKPGDKVYLRELSTSGRPGRVVASVDGFEGLEQWARDNDEAHLADWAAGEHGGKPAKKAAPAKAAPAKRVPAKKAAPGAEAAPAKAPGPRAGELAPDQPRQPGDLVAVWRVPGAAPIEGTVVGRFASGAPRLVNWDGGRVEKLLPTDPSVRFAKQGSQIHDWLLDPDSLDEAWRRDRGAVILTINDELHDTLGREPRATDVRKRLGELGIDVPLDELRPTKATPAKKATGKAVPEPPAPSPADQHRIQAAHSVANALVDVDELLSNGASEKALRHRIDAVGGQHGTPDEVRRELLAALPDTREVEVENRIRAAYRDLQRRPGDWVPIADLRDRIGGVDRAEIDAALTRMAVQPGSHVIPWDNRKALTDRDRDASVRIGGDDNHAIRLERPEDRAVPSPDPQRLRTALDRIAEQHGLTVVGGRAGEQKSFDRASMKPIGGAIDDGSPVVVVRPGYALGDTQLSQAVVQARPGGRTSAPDAPKLPAGQNSWSGHSGLDVTDEEERDFLTYPLGKREEILGRIRSGAPVAGGARGTHFGTKPDPDLAVSPQREAEIRAAVEQIAAANSTHYVDLKIVREGLAGRFRRDEVDHVILKLNRSGDWTVAPDTAQESLTPRTRLAAVVTGNQDKHLLRVLRRGPVVESPAAQAVVQERPRIGPTAPSLTVGNTPAKQALYEKVLRETGSTADAWLAAATMDDSAPDVNPPDAAEARRDALDLKKVDELKAMLKERGLPVSGKKRDLVDRLVEADASADSEPAVSAGEPARAATGPDVPGLAAALRGGGSEVEMIQVLAADPGLNNARLRDLAAELDIDVPPDMRAKTSLQLYIAQEANRKFGSGDGNLAGRAPAPTPPTRAQAFDVHDVAGRLVGTRDEAGAAAVLEGLNLSELRKVARELRIGLPSDLVHSPAGGTYLVPKKIAADELRQYIVQQYLRDRGRFTWRSVSPDEDDAVRAAGHDITPGHGAEQRDRELALLGITRQDGDEELRAMAVDGDEFEAYWTRGKGLARWRLKPHPWTTLHRLLAKHPKVRDPEGLATTYFHKVFGYYPGSDLHRVAYGKPPRGERIGPG